ncbi:uncharacterized protein LOC126736345 [Anthonomus grandis grandis]|uniref:uncharacterized protein LOC126736345 n=1 Tax=Anthonomus grandis grandis TaxID=2921223 RepID=UPI002165FD09|nr:uncharacterized protein LOC126736345 [Anthonomus grandis grandis]
MVPNSGKFKCLNGEIVVLNVEKGQGCLRVSIKRDYEVLSYKKCLLFASQTCAVILSQIYVSLYVGIALFFILLVTVVPTLFSIKEENIIIVKGLGYQINRKYALTTNIKFIPSENVQNIFINEVILRYKVIHLLSLIVLENNKKTLIPLLSDMLPRLDCLETIYKAIKQFENS